MSGEVKDPDVMLLPPLYVPTKRGKRQVWKVWTQNDKVYKAFGVVGGKIRILEPVVCTAKHVGAANEIPAPDQAVLQARREWIKKLDKGYKPAAEDETGQRLYSSALEAKGRQNNTNRAVEQSFEKEGATPVTGTPAAAAAAPLLPMHATKYESAPKCLKHLDFARGVYCQPKLDGVRCVARLAGEAREAVLTSRTGKRFPHCAAIRADVAALLEGAPGLILDGEIYAHTLVDPETGRELEHHERFNEIAGAATHARKAPSRFEPQLEYHVFDLVDPGSTLDQDARFRRLDQLLGPPKTPRTTVVNVKRVLLRSEAEVKELHVTAVAEGYEGVVLRDRALLYEMKHRSLKLRKLKATLTSEFTIVGAKEGVGAAAGAVIWRCAAGPGVEFDVPPRGNRETRKEYYARYADYIGALLLVNYQSLGGNGVPRFPVGVGIRREFERAAELFAA